MEVPEMRTTLCGRPWKRTRRIERTAAVVLAMVVSSGAALAADHREAPLIRSLIVGTSASESAQGIVVNQCRAETELVILVTPRIIQEVPAPEEEQVGIPMLLAAGEARTFDIALGLPLDLRRYASVEVRAWPGTCTAPGLDSIELAAVVLGPDGGQRAVVLGTKGFGFVQQGNSDAAARSPLPPLGGLFRSRDFIGPDEEAEATLANLCPGTAIEYTVSITNLSSAEVDTVSGLLDAGGLVVIPLNGVEGWRDTVIETIPFDDEAGDRIPCPHGAVAAASHTFSTEDGGTVGVGLLLPAIQGGGCFPHRGC
jgi:hypothetical protein